MEKIKLVKHSEMGGYQVNYIFDGHKVVCGCCAEKIVNNDDYDMFVENEKEYEQFIHWEGDSMYCENCNEEIYSEYEEID